MIMPVCGKTNPAAADASVGHDDHQDLLDDLMAQVAPCFARRETRLTCKDMVHGLLSELEDRNCWTLAEAAGHACPYRMQHLLSRARCDEQRMLDTAAGWAVGRLSAGQDGADAVLIVDETADEKSSDSCAGASHQYSGTVGGTAMCQVAVTLTWAAPAGHALIGRALYLPEGWAADEERRELAGVPDEITFETKPQLAGDLLQYAHDQGIRAGSATKGAKDYDWAMIGILPDDTPDGQEDNGHAFLLLRRHRYTSTVSYSAGWTAARSPPGPPGTDGPRSACSPISSSLWPPPSSGPATKTPASSG